MGSGAFLTNPRNRLIVILTTFFALVILILAPRSSDRDGYNNGSRFSWSKATTNSLFGWVGKSKVEEVMHPIPQLMHDAQVKFRAKIVKQSKTLAAAVKEYRARYKRDPPKGFDEWFQFAQDNKVRIIDEYDGLMNDLDPFWSLSGEELRRRALQACTRPLKSSFGLTNASCSLHRLDRYRPWTWYDYEMERPSPSIWKKDLRIQKSALAPKVSVS